MKNEVSDDIGGITFEKKENWDIFLTKIRKNNLKNGVKYLFTILSVVSLYIIISFITNQNRLYKPAYPYVSPNWLIVNLIVYSIFLWIRINLFNFSPLLIKFLKQEINILDFKVRKRFFSKYLFISSNVILMILIILTYYQLISFNDLVIIMLMNILLTSMILISLFSDKVVVDVKDDYYIRFDFKYQRKEDGILKIYLSSNRLTRKNNFQKGELYKKIAQERWLPKKGRFKTFYPKLNPFYHFYEFANPINLKNQFLNLILALKKWDMDKDVILQNKERLNQNNKA